MSTGLSLSPQISDEFAKICSLSLAVTEPKSNSSLPDDPLVVKGLARLRGCDHKVLPEFSMAQDYYMSEVRIDQIELTFFQIWPPDGALIKHTSNCLKQPINGVQVSHVQIRMSWIFCSLILLRI